MMECSEERECRDEEVEDIGLEKKVELEHDQPRQGSDNFLDFVWICLTW